jgi:shikimate dehydrogenase
MTARCDRSSYVLGLVGAGISASLTPAMHEREGREQGLSVAYRLIDIAQQRIDEQDLADLLTWAVRLGFDGLNVTHPVKQAIVPLLDELSEAAEILGAVNTVVIRDGRTVGHNTDWSGFGRSFARVLPAHTKDRMVLLGAGGAGAAVAYAVLNGGAEHLTVVDPDEDRRSALVGRLEQTFGADRIGASQDVAVALTSAHGLIHATPTGMANYPGLPLDPELLCPDLWVAEVVYFPLETELVSVARTRGCRVEDGGGMAVFQAVAAFELFTGVIPDADRMQHHFRTLVTESSTADAA